MDAHTNYASATRFVLVVILNVLQIFLPRCEALLAGGVLAMIAHLVGLLPDLKLLHEFLFGVGPPVGSLRIPHLQQ